MSRARSGFSLIELIVVIAVVAVLGAIGAAAVGHLRYAAMEAESASNIRQLAEANLTYLAEHGTYAPNADMRDRVHWHGERKGGGFDGRGGYLSGYLEGGAVRMCPVLEDYLDEETGSSFDEGTGGYGYNATYIGGQPHRMEQPVPLGATRGSFRPWWTYGNLPAKVPNPGRVVMFTSTAIVRGGGIVETGNAVPYRHLEPGSLGEVATPTVHFRFKGRAVVAWADGHVTFEEPNDVSTAQNVYGDDNAPFSVGWFGEVSWNGPWNPYSRQERPY